MATTFSGLGILSRFSIIFIILLVFVVVYGVLEYVAIFKDKKGLNAIIALAIAFLVAVSGTATFMIQHFATWFFVLGFFIFLILVMLGIFGLKEKDFLAAGRQSKVYTWIIIIALIIAFFALGKAFGQKLLEGGGEETPQIPVEGAVSVEGIPVEGSTAGTGDSGLVRTTPQGTTQGSDFSSNVLQTFISPPVLGLILILMVGAFSITFMTRS